MAGAVRGGGSRGQYRTTESRRTYTQGTARGADSLGTDGLRSSRYAYVDGTAVRKIQSIPEKKQERTPAKTSRATRKNRERALQMNFGYVLFLTAAAVITVFMCVNYLQLQAKGTKLQKEVTALETQLDSAKLQNDSEYNRIMANVDMEHVKDVAMNELGMVRAKKSQIVTYEIEDNDYVRQYSEIPEE